MKTPILDKAFHDWMAGCFGHHWCTTMAEIEITERQRAFFSGFASYYFFSMGLAALADLEAEKRLQALHEEIKSYFAQIKHVPRNIKDN